MAYNKSNIKTGIERFMAGDTTLEEEEALRAYFRYSDPPEGLEDIAAYFALIDAHEPETGLDEAFDQELLQQIKVPKHGRFIWRTPRRWLSVAAILLAVFAIYVYRNYKKAPVAANTPSHSQEEIRQAFDQAKAALLLVGGGLDKGRSQAAHITEFNKAQQKIKAP